MTDRHRSPGAARSVSVSPVSRAWIVALVVASTSTAQAGNWRWIAPAGCSDEASLRAAIAARVESSVDPSSLDVDVSIVSGDGGFTATLVVGGAIADSRTLTSASCAELTDAIAIVIARLASLAEAPRVAVVEPTPVALVEIGPVIAGMTEHVPRWDAGARLSGVVGIGAAPALGIAADLGVWARWRALSVEVALAHWKANTATVGDRSMAGVDVGLETVAVRAGWRFSGRVRSWLVGELGTIEGTGVQIAGPQRGSARWTGAGAGGAYAWPLADHVALVAAAEAKILIDRVTFALEGGAVLYRTPPVAVCGSLGIEIGWR